MDKIKLGSKTAKEGFLNEKFVIAEFNAWHKSPLAKHCLVKMGYNLDEIKSVLAEKIKGSFKADLQVQIQVRIEFKEITDNQNISVKLVSNAKKGFNQIERGWVDKYKKLWGFDDEIERILKLYTGEIAPYKATRDDRRMFLDEMNESEQNAILQWFENNQQIVLSSVLKGKGQYQAEWLLVIQKYADIFRWEIMAIDKAIECFGGKAVINKNGNLKIGKIGIQRKGGDGGRNVAKQLQFKLNPLEIFVK